MTYNDDEVKSLMKEKNLTESQAKRKIYCREWYKNFYNNHRDERLEYYRKHRKEKKDAFPG